MSSSTRRVAYIDAFSGVAGDMLLAALIDNGLDVESIKSALKTLTTIEHEWDITVSSVVRSEGMIGAKHINVKSIYNHEPALVPGTILGHNRNHNLSTNNNSTALTLIPDAHNHNHQHNHSHSHGHGHSHGHKNDHDVFQAHDHEHPIDHSIILSASSDNSHGHSHEHHGHDGHEHHDRGLQQITDIVAASTLPPHIQQLAIVAFTELAVAESRVHATSLENVHFHEVGAIDSIVDTVGVIIGFHLLGITEVYCSALPMSSGTVWTAHGLLPVPAPATLQLMQGMALVPGPKGASGELVTPTGACLIRALCGMSSLQKNNMTSSSTTPVMVRQGVLPPPGFRLLSVGVGAGTKDFPKHPNILRILIGEIPNINNPTPERPLLTDSHSLRLDTTSTTTMIQDQGHVSTPIIQTNTVPVSLPLPTPPPPLSTIHTTTTTSSTNDLWIEEEMLVLEANIDDMSAEIIAHVLDQLLKHGARDVWSQSIGMKKNRPGVLLSVLCVPEHREKLLIILFQQSTTIGVRIRKCDRAALRRKFVTLTTSYGDIQAKISYLGDQRETVKPEFDDCQRIAERENISLKRVQDAAHVVAQAYYNTSY